MIWFGIYPLYYAYIKDEGIYIASEIKTLTKILKPKICLQAVSEILKYGYIVSDKTMNRRYI